MKRERMKNMECVGRIDNVIAYFEEIDKVNIEYEDIYEHDLTKKR